MIEQGATAARAVAALRDLLAKEGREALLPRVGRAFGRLADREAQRSTLVLSVAREKDERSAKHDAKEVLAQLKIESGDLKTQVDDTLVGGWRLEGRGVLVDRSYKSQLLDLYNRAISS